jgi:hypothetical protein
MRGIACFLLVLSGIIAAAQKADVTVRSLLGQMADLRRLAILPDPPYTVSQASSYDRDAVSPDKENWFANGDFGKFLRVEHIQGRDEYVMADLKGPGAVVRIWSANPQGTIRFYVDGKPLAELIAKMEDLLSGKHPDFPPPFSHRLANGANLYYPIPYQKSLKITVDNIGSNPASLYYHINYRTYRPGVTVTSFSTLAVKDAAKMAEKVADQLNKAAHVRVEGERTLITSETLAPGKILALRTPSTSGEIRELKITVAADEPLGEMDYRRLLLEADFDGYPCIASPLGDFFSIAPGLVDFNSLPLGIAGKTMTSRWVMPQRETGRLFLTNYLAKPITVTMEATWAPEPWTEGTMHFHAGWRRETMRTRPMRDWNFLTAEGEGRFVGCSFFVANPVGDWWGEGDEKIYVDGETFPSTFGTGTEDYFGYAWSSPTLFQHPYHNQLRCDGPGTRGYTALDRFHIFDDVTFTKYFKFDMEVWHWRDVVADFAVTAYWYQLPGGSNGFSRPSQSDLAFFPIPEPLRVIGAAEGEDMKILSKTGGETEVQTLGEEFSAFKQIWWRDGRPGDRISFEIPCANPGTLTLSGAFCTAADYAIIQLWWNDEKLGEPVDFFHKGVKPIKLEFGPVVAREKNTLTVEIVGANPEAIKRHMFGLDYLVLK